MQCRLIWVCGMFFSSLDWGYGFMEGMIRKILEVMEMFYILCCGGFMGVYIC